MKGANLDILLTYIYMYKQDELSFEELEEAIKRHYVIKKKVTRKSRAKVKEVPNLDAFIRSRVK